jgi:hypothetical protein
MLFTLNLSPLAHSLSPPAVEPVCLPHTSPPPAMARFRRRFSVIRLHLPSPSPSHLLCAAAASSSPASASPWSPSTMTAPAPCREELAMNSVLFRQLIRCSVLASKRCKAGKPGRVASTWFGGMATEVLGSVSSGVLRRQSQVWFFVEAEGVQGCVPRGKWRSPFPTMKVGSSRPSRPCSTPAMPHPPSDCVVSDVRPLCLDQMRVSSRGKSLSNPITSIILRRYCAAIVFLRLSISFILTRV